MPQDELDEALTSVATAIGKDEEDDAIAELVEAAAKADKATQQEAIEVIAAKTRKTKKQAEELLKEERGNRSRELIDVEKIEKVVPVGDSDEYRYRFTLLVDGEHGVVELPSSKLMSQHVFKQQIFEMTDHLADFDDWEKTLNGWMQETEIEERKEDPISAEHALAESLINRIRGMLTTRDSDVFRMRPMNTCKLEDGDGVLLLAGQVVDDVRQDLRGEVSMRRAQSILEPYLLGGSRSIRNGDDFFRAWQFDAGKLEEQVDIDLAPPEDQEGESGGAV